VTTEHPQLDVILNDLSCSDATGLLRAYELRRHDADEARDAKNTLGDLLRRHFKACSDEHTDGEHGLRGGLRQQEITDFDLIQMATHNPQDIITLALRGCLSVSIRQARGLRGKDAAVDRLWRYRMPRMTEQLYVERTRR